MLLSLKSNPPSYGYSSYHICSLHWWKRTILTCFVSDLCVCAFYKAAIKLNDFVLVWYFSIPIKNMLTNESIASFTLFSCSFSSKRFSICCDHFKKNEKSIAHYWIRIYKLILYFSKLTKASTIKWIFPSWLDSKSHRDWWIKNKFSKCIKGGWSWFLLVLWMCEDEIEQQNHTFGILVLVVYDYFKHNKILQIFGQLCEFIFSQ